MNLSKDKSRVMTLMLRAMGGSGVTNQKPVFLEVTNEKPVLGQEGLYL